MKNQIEIIPGRCIEAYQKITFRITNPTAITMAQNAGRSVHRQVALRWKLGVTVHQAHQLRRPVGAWSYN